MQERSDKRLDYLKTYVAEIAMLEFIKDNNLIENNDYKKLKNKIENEYAKYNRLNNSEYSFAWIKYLNMLLFNNYGKE